MGASPSVCSTGCQGFNPCISNETQNLQCLVKSADADILAPIGKVAADAVNQARPEYATSSRTPDTRMHDQEGTSEVTETLATETFTVTVDMSDPSAKLGIVVDFSNDYSMVVKYINPGLIQRWNLENPSRQIRETDHIVEVNGTRGNAEQLVDLCRTRTQLHLLVDRLSTSAVTSNGMALPVEKCRK